MKVNQVVFLTMITVSFLASEMMRGDETIKDDIHNGVNTLITTKNINALKALVDSLYYKFEGRDKNTVDVESWDAGKESSIYKAWYAAHSSLAREALKVYNIVSDAAVKEGSRLHGDAPNRYSYGKLGELLQYIIKQIIDSNDLKNARIIFEAVSSGPDQGVGLQCIHDAIGEALKKGSSNITKLDFTDFKNKCLKAGPCKDSEKDKVFIGNVYCQLDYDLHQQIKTGAVSPSQICKCENGCYSLSLTSTDKNNTYFNDSCRKACNRIKSPYELYDFDLKNIGSISYGNFFAKYHEIRNLDISEEMFDTIMNRFRYCPE